jgi:pSer/pThr/pTyr-binding forkhead associated (FHA) protein
LKSEQGRREFNLDGRFHSRSDAIFMRDVLFSVSICLPSPLVSTSLGYYRIVDGNLRGQGSANGLLVNGRKLQSHDLQNFESCFSPDVRHSYYLLKREQIHIVPPMSFITSDKSRHDWRS